MQLLAEDLFARFDANHDGRLDGEEQRLGKLRWLLQKARSTDLATWGNQVFDQADANHDGTVSEAEIKGLGFALGAANGPAAYTLGYYVFDLAQKFDTTEAWNELTRDEMKGFIDYLTGLRPTPPPTVPPAPRA